MTAAVSMASLNIPSIGSGMSSAPAQAVGGKSFKEFLTELAGNKNLTGGLDMQADMNKIQTALAEGKSLPTTDLLFYQIKAGQFGLRVELLSKFAEAMSSTVKKFQSGQA